MATRKGKPQLVWVTFKFQRSDYLNENIVVK